MRLEPLGECRIRPDEDEVRRRRRALEACRDERRAEPLALGDGRFDVAEARRAERGCADRGGGACDGRRRPTLGEERRRVRMREGEADPKSCEPERLGERSQNHEVGQLVDPRRTRPGAILDIRLVYHDDRLGLRSGKRDDLLGLDPPAGRVVGVADPAQIRRIPDPDDVSTMERRRDAVESVRRRVDRRSPPRPEERQRQKEDQIVGAGPDDDVLGYQRDVAGCCLAKLAIRAVRVLVQPCHAVSERHLGHARKRRRVLVELQDCLTRHAVTFGDLGDAGRPDVGREAVSDRLGLLARDAHAVTAAAWSGSPSARASGPTTSAARRTPSLVAVTIWRGLRNASIPSPPVDRASPPVGSTCVAPAA